ncbi:MAG: UDP-2-acetamido-2-deoxy-ribo-hexuluronate aminotransferase [Candidatus Endobugula sp.]|jgi:UDP-2-acetamido-2-deoxy-ribo-hexuluronate aminotransferase
MNYLVDLNIIFDYYNHHRKERFSESVDVFDTLHSRGDVSYISSSSLVTLEFTKGQELKREYGESRKIIIREFIEDVLSKFKLAKTPSYLEIDYDDIEGSQIMASAYAVNAKVITRNNEMLEKYPDTAISAHDYLRLPANKSIDFANLKKQYFDLQPQIEKQMDEVLSTTSFIMGAKVKELEENLQEFTKAKHAITCSNGTDALLLAMMAMDIQPGDEVITTPFTFISTAETIALMKAKPVFVDIETDTYNIDATKIEAAITDKTKAIMPVSLYGQPADMGEIQTIADRFNLKVIIDGAQSFGSTYEGKTDSNLGDISTTSFFPAKPLGCYGDGGAVFTNNDEYAQKIRMMRVHGQNKQYHHQYIGMGGRLDTLQAAVLLAKLPHFSKEAQDRQAVAEKYNAGLKDYLVIPQVKSERTSVWAQYTLRLQNRDQVQMSLKEKGIPTAVYYPVPLHLQKCFEYLGAKAGEFPRSEKAAKEVMSLPMNPFLSDKEISYIIKAVKSIVS